MISRRALQTNVLQPTLMVKSIVNALPGRGMHNELRTLGSMDLLVVQFDW